MTIAIKGDGIPDNPILELARLKEENERLKKLAPKPTYGMCKISEKTGAVCLYGLQKYPITLYANQWEQLKELLPNVLKFIEENADKVARPPEKN